MGERVPRLKLSTVKPVMVEALCYHEALRRLGYAPNEIYVSVDAGKMFVILKIDDSGNRFMVSVGKIAKVSPEIFKREWAAACDAWNNSPASELEKVFSGSVALANAFDLSAALVAKGFNRHVTRDGQN